MAVGSEDSYIFAFYAGGQSQGERSDGSYDPACSTLDENHFTKQLDWVNVCLGPNTIDSCSCSDCVENTENNCFALNVAGEPACKDTQRNPVIGTGYTRSCCENLDCNHDATSCGINNIGNCSNDFYKVGPNEDHDCISKFGYCLPPVTSLASAITPNVDIFQIAEGTTCEQYVVFERSVRA